MPSRCLYTSSPTCTWTWWVPGYVHTTEGHTHLLWIGLQDGQRQFLFSQQQHRWWQTPSWPAGFGFWGSSYHHNRPGDPVHRWHVAVHVQSPGRQARANYCLPPAVQQDGVALSPAAEGGAMCQVQRSGLAGTPSLGAVGSTCCAKGGGWCLIS